MHITYNKEHRIWIAHTQYGEHTAVKKAGFWWHPQVGRCRYSKCKACAAGLVKVWWSFKPEAALRVVEYCDESAKAALQGHIEAVAGSKAADADIDIPCPDGVAYMPFQKAGIRAKR